MTDAVTGQVSADAARVYDEFFVPALFAQWTATMLDTAGVAGGDRVLDVGCGTGVLTRAAADRVGVPDRVTGVDPNEGMLRVARGRAPDLVWQAGVVEDLPFPDGTFDRVLCQFAAMFFTDQERGLREMNRVTSPGGTVTLATWTDVSSSPGYEAMVALIRRLFGDVPADALLAPFTLGTTEVVRTLVEPALPGVRVSRVEGTARFPSLRAWVETDVRGWTLRDMIGDAQLELLVDAAERELTRFVDPEGRVAFDAPALVATAVRR